MKKKNYQQKKEPLKLIRWKNDHYPPIVMHDQVKEVIKLIKEIEVLRHRVQLEEQEIKSLQKINQILTSEIIMERDKKVICQKIVGVIGFIAFIGLCIIVYNLIDYIFTLWVK